MSDFFNAGWSIYIIVIVVGGLLGCLALLIMAARRRVIPGDDTTGHVWDEDLRELNNPLPRWWMGMFVLTIVFAAVYLALYPGLGNLPGTKKWTSLEQHKEEQRLAREKAAPVYDGFAKLSFEQLALNPEAHAVGQRLFANNCAMCHGSDARGSKGFPNLTDSDWLWGGTPERIIETITNGRDGNMPPQVQLVGGPQDVHNVANYVLSLSNSPHDAVAAAEGKKKFAICSACHGPDGKGNQMLGAPNLTDDIWLHGYGEDAIAAMVNNGKVNQMPAQKDRLTPEQIRVLASYVWAFSNTSNAANAPKASTP